VDLLYSLTLALALLAAGLALLAAPWVRSRRVAQVAAALALALDGVSLAAHLAVGHRPGSAAALAPAAFLAEHPAFLVVACIGALAFAVSGAAARGTRRRPGS
jgi:hypothetical protein